MKVVYYDLGLHKEAPEIVMFRDICKSLELDYTIYGIEACPDYIPHLKEKFKDDENIHIFNFAIGDSDGETKLYRTKAFDGEGNSVYASKNNVDETWFDVVPMRKLSNVMDYWGMKHGDIQVLKYNIEGAELQMMTDLIDTGKHKEFQIFCGATPDIHKCAEIADKQGDYEKMLLKHLIIPFLFHAHYNPAEVRNMKQRMKMELKLLIHNASKRKE